MAECWVCNLGITDYDEASELQRRLRQLRFQESIEDIVLFTEHPPTITLGRFAGSAAILVDEAELRLRNVSVCRSDRGGDATLHCPGQLVVNPVLNLKNRGGRLREYLHNLEEVALSTLADFGIQAGRLEHPGIWVNDRQIGAIGLRISQGISTHGLALNVDPDMTLFEMINLCGIPGTLPTSMAGELAHPVEMRAVMDHFTFQFSQIFAVKLEQISAAQVTQEAGYG